MVDDTHIKLFGNSKCYEISSLVRLFPNLDGFAKLSNGECANGVYTLHINDGKILLNGKETNDNELIAIFKDHRYIVQQRITQHERIRALFPKAINTIRLVTVYNRKDKKVEPFSAFLRIGTGNSHVDNTSAGGLAVGIDLTLGTLKEYGFYKPQFGTKVNRHPDTGIYFKNYEIPFYKEAMQMAILFHENLFGIHSIGWDIAITPDGPCFIEGNDNWEISGPQVCNGGLKKRFKELFY